VAVTLSVVIPTLGRPTLERALRSCADADEIVVVLDKARGATGLPCELPPNAVYLEGEYGVTGGHAGRAAGIRVASGTHLAFFDDDDEYAPGAIGLMRAAATDVPVIFRMDHYAHGILWRDRELRFGNVSTQMYVVPNDPHKLGTWEPHVPGIQEPGGDYTFIRQTVERMGGPVWRDEVIAILRPDEPRPPTVSVVTPWMGHPELAHDYVQALEVGGWPTEAIIVDNGDAPDLPCQIIRPTRNLGFSLGSNLGLEHATGDIVVFLNNDIAPTRLWWLRELRDAVEPGVLAGPLQDPDHAAVDGTRYPYIDGWCLAGMRDELIELGGFPALHEPAYYSDNILCLEARAAGMALRHVPVGLRHKLSATAGPEGNPMSARAAAANRDVYINRVRGLMAVAG
jgi:glycosyltransferase involved in cell wall biosynthesis